MGFGRDRTVAHRARAEAAQNRLDRIDLFQRHGRSPRLEFQHAAQMAFARRLFVDQLREFAIRQLVALSRGLLNVGDVVRVPGVLLAGRPPGEQAHVGEDREIVVVSRGVAQLVTTDRFLTEDVEADAADPAGGSPEALVDDLVAQPDSLEDLGTLVALQRRDPHLGHHFEDALLRGFAVRGCDLIVRPIAAEFVVVLELPQGFKRHVRVDGIGPVARQQTEVMDFASLARFDDDAEPRPLFIEDEVMMYGTCGEEGADRQTARAGESIRQDDETESAVNRPTSLTTNAVERPHQSGRSLRLRIGHVDRLGLPAAMVEMLDRGQLFIGQDRMRHREPMALRLGRVEQIAFGADVALQRHDDLFARAVDRGVRHLREELLEVVEQRTRLIAEAGQRRVIAHRTDRVFFGRDHRNEHELQRFGRVPERLHVLEQLVADHPFGGTDGGQLVQQQPLVLQPLLVRTAIGEVLLEFFIGDQATLLEIDQEHLARLEAALLFDIGRVDVEYSNFARHDDAVVVRDVVAAGAEAVAVEGRSNDVAVGERDRRRAIPRLLQGRVIFVEGAFVLGHRVVVLPRFGDHHHDRFGQTPSGHQQQFERVIKIARVGTMRLDNWKEFLKVIAKQRTLHHSLPRDHPVGVAAHRVDLTVMSHVTLRMGTVPTGEGVRREAAVNHREVRRVLGVLQVDEERLHLLGREHSFVDQGLGREGAGIELQRLFELPLADRM